MTTTSESKEIPRASNHVYIAIFLDFLKKSRRWTSFGRAGSIAASRLVPRQMNCVKITLEYENRNSAAAMLLSLWYRLRESMQFASYDDLLEYLGILIKGWAIWIWDRLLSREFKLPWTGNF